MIRTLLKKNRSWWTVKLNEKFSEWLTSRLTWSAASFIWFIEKVLEMISKNLWSPCTTSLKFLKSFTEVASISSSLRPVNSVWSSLMKKRMKKASELSVKILRTGSQRTLFSSADDLLTKFCNHDSEAVGCSEDIAVQKKNIVRCTLRSAYSVMRTWSFQGLSIIDFAESG